MVPAAGPGRLSAMPKGPARAWWIGLSTLGVLVLAGAGRVWAHYRATPGFDAWLRERPVQDAVWRAAVPRGVELARGARWRSDDGPARARFGQWRSRTTISHGTRTLLDLEVEVRVESRAVADAGARGVPSEAFEGLEVFVTVRGLDPDVHGVAVLSLVDFERNAAPEPPQGPRMQLDVFALAGPGTVELVVQDVAGASGGLDAALLDERAFPGASAWVTGEVLARFLSLEDPPEEGLAWQTRCAFTPTWTAIEGGTQGAALHEHAFAATTAMYSAHLRSIHAVRSPFAPADRFGPTTTDEVRRDYRWNGEVW